MTRIITTAVVPAALLFLAFDYFRAISDSLPYYVAPDMDLTTVVDGLLIRAGYLPSHLGHPGFGMYLAQSHMQTATEWLGMRGVFDLNDLETALNPLLVSAASTNRLRSFSPILALVIAVGSWRAVVRLSRAEAGAAVLVLALFLSQPSLIYHSGLIRSELYAIAYWSLALWLASSLLVDTSRSRTALTRPLTIAGWLGVGVLVGLSLTTKVQGLILVLILPAWIALAAHVHTPTWSPGPTLTRPFPRALSWFTAANLVGAAALFWLASRVEVPVGVATFAAGYSLNPIGALIMLAVLSTAILSQVRDRVPPWIGEWNAMATLIVSGILLSFLLHFSLYASPESSLQYLLLDFKVAFLRNLPPKLAASDPLLAMQGQWLIPGAHALALAAFVIRFRSRPVVLLLAFATSALLLAHIGLALRPRVRDQLWLEIPMNGLTACYALWWLQTSSSRKHVATVVVLLLAVGMVATNLEDAKLARSRLVAAFSTYGFHPQSWFAGVYLAEHMRYTQVMRDRIPQDSGMRDPAQRQARVESDLLANLDSTFLNHRILHTNVGVLWPGFAVRSGSIGGQVTRVPDALRDLATVDLRAAPVTNRLRAPVPIPNARLWRERFAADSTSTEPITTVVSRSDRPLFLFLSTPPTPKVLWPNPGCRLRDQNESIGIATHGGEALDLHAYRVFGICTWPDGTLPPDSLFAVG